MAPTQTQTTVELEPMETTFRPQHLDSKGAPVVIPDSDLSTHEFSRPTSERRLGAGSSDNAQSPAAAQEFSSLPPADGGPQALLFLAACFLVEALIWGFPFAFGVFRSFYSLHPDFAGSPNIAVIGTCAMGLMYFSGPVVIGLMRAFPRQARWAPPTGLVITCVALGTSSLSTTVGQLIATQGVLYALGGALAYIPCIVYMDEWFVRRKGLAYGIMWSGKGLAGVIFPLLMETLLERVGFRTTLRIWSGALFALTAPLAYFIRPRIPPLSRARAASEGGSVAALRKPLKNMGFVLSRSFMLYQAANMIEALGYFLPSIYLPSYARTFLGAGSFAAAASLLFVNVASVFGCVLMGWFVDRWPAPSCLFLSSAGAAVGTLLIWGMGTNMASVYAFGAVYGLFAGAYTSAWPGIMLSVAESERKRGRGIDPVLVFGWLAAGRGVGNMVSGPLSEALIEGYPWKGEAGFGYGSGYGTLIAFTGVTALLGGASLGFKHLKWL